MFLPFVRVVVEWPIVTNHFVFILSSFFIFHPKKKLSQANLIHSQNMKFVTALKFLVASEALRVMYIRFGVRAQSVLVDRTSDANVADAAASDVLLETLSVDSGGGFFPTAINNLRVIIPAMPPGAMASKGIIMIITLGPTAKIHGVMTSGRTENATPTPYQQKTELVINLDVYLIALFVLADR